MRMMELAAMVVAAVVVALLAKAAATALPAAPVVLERVPLKDLLMPDLRQRDRARHAKVGVVNFPVEGTIAPYSDGLYYTRVKVGNPPKEFIFQFTTGISTTILACKGCTACPADNLLTYNADASSTSSRISCSDGTCAAAQIESAVCQASGSPSGGDLCALNFTFGDVNETRADGYYVSDTMSFETITGTQHSVNSSSASVVFGCTKSVPKLMDTDGMLGFGPNEQSIISQLHSQGLSPKVFSHCLKGSEKGGGIFVLGRIAAPGLVYTPLASSKSSYIMNLESIAVNGNKLPIDPSLFATSNSQGTVVDSGTSLAYIVDGAHGPLGEAIAALIPPSVRPVDTRLIAKSEQQDKCFVSSGSMDLLFPTVTLYFKGNAAMTVKPSHYLVQQGASGNDSIWCIGWMSSQVLPNSPEVTILGDIVLHDKLIVYDLEKKRMGWTDYNCSSLNTSSPVDVSGAPAYYSGVLITVVVASVWLLGW